MERYTEKHYDGNGYYLICSGNCETFNCGDCGILDKIVDRLAAYEDTGLEPEDFKRTFTEDALLKLTGQLLGVTPDRLRELAQADNEGRCVVLDDLTVSDLHQMLTELTAICYGDGEETYTTGYRNGRKNGKIEILRSVLGVHEGASEKAEAALEGMKNG